MLFNYARSMDFEQKPDYAYMRRGLKSVLDNYFGNFKRPVLDWHAVLNISHGDHQVDAANENKSNGPSSGGAVKSQQGEMHSLSPLKYATNTVGVGKAIEDTINPCGANNTVNRGGSPDMIEGRGSIEKCNKSPKQKGKILNKKANSIKKKKKGKRLTTAGLKNNLTVNDNANKNE